MLKNNGFTLLELLVVIVIIGIASTVIVLNIGSRFFSAKNSEFFARQMLSLLQLARQQAIFGSEVIGVNISNKEYRFLKLSDTEKNQKWQSLSTYDRVWKPYPIPSNLRVSLHETNTQNKQGPQIIIQPSGELTPFIIDIRGGNNTKAYKIQGIESGMIGLE